MAEVALRNVTKRFDNVEAVRGISLDIPNNEFVVLVGPSGCGKSTTLRMVAGLEEVSAGDIYIGGELVNDLPPKDRDIAMVFQNYALYPHMTAFENMSFGLKLRKFSKEEIKKRVDNAARILDIVELLDRKPKALSGGQRQRVAMGRAIVRDPKVFLFDEPLSNLDAQLRAQMRLELKELRQRVPTTSIFVTHDQTEAMTLGDRIVVMKEGFVQQVGTPLELYRKPANRFVASFIGSPSMNFITADVTAEADHFLLACRGWQFKLPIARFPDLRSRMGRSVCIGMRPQHIRLGAPMNDNQIAFKGTVMVTEQLGDEQLLAIRLGDGEIRIAGVDPDLTLPAGSEIEAAVATENLHFFDDLEKTR